MTARMSIVAHRGHGIRAPTPHDDATERLQAKYARLQHRLDAMYVDKLDGRIDAASFDRMAATWWAD